MSTVSGKILVAVSLAAIATTGGAAYADALRTVRDPAHQRVWILERDTLYLQEGSGRKVRYELPDWIHAGEPYACPPDLALDARGAALVTSNVMPVLWRVDAAAGQLTRHELALDSDQDKDVGFSSLRYSRKSGAFLAVNALDGSRWAIDPALRRATKLREAAPRAVPDVSSRRGTTCATR